MRLVIALAALALVAAPAIAVQTLDLTPAGLGVYYLNDDNTVWEETNSHGGLQMAAFCEEGIQETEDGRCLDVDTGDLFDMIPADEQVA